MIVSNETMTESESEINENNLIVGTVFRYGLLSTTQKQCSPLHWTYIYIIAVAKMVFERYYRVGVWGEDDGA